MEVVTGATGNVMIKVGALLQDECIRQKGVQKDVESLQKELFFMRAALCKVAVVPPEHLDEQVKAWASNVKELSYDMEDAVDTFTVRVTASKDHSRSRIVGMGKWDRFTARRELADMIAEMKDLTMQVADLRDRYKLDDIHVMNTIEQVQEVKEVVSRNFQLWTWWRQCMFYRIREVWAEWHRSVNEFILAANGSWKIPIPGLGLINRIKDSPGMCDDMKTLHNWLNKKDKKGGVLYVIGDEGVGKTTVAKSLYHKFGHLFDRRAIVMASSWGLDDKAIVCEIKKQLRSDLKTKEDETALRHLLLIDGVESEETWKKINDDLFKPGLLPIGSHSKTIVTTRHSTVASTWNEEQGDLRHTQTAGKIEEAKLIFMQALRESTRGDEAEDNIPPRVWEMCAKQPVAITAMAGYAACNRGKSWDAWKEVCNKLLPDSVKGLTRDGIPRVLSHCYHDMSAELETCCLYLSMFPKGSSVSRKHLARRWIAEGFVGEKPGWSVEEVADDYFDQLVWRKLVQPVDISKNGKVKNCQVYGMVHDFIMSKASQENLVTVVGGGFPTPPPNGKVRRLSLSIPASSDSGAGDGEGPYSSKNMPHVRSLAVFTARELPSALLGSPIMQVLDLEGCKGVKVTKRHMGVICKMFLLKYLSVRRTNIKEIGRDIGRLKNLETLDVRETQVIYLPDTIWKLQKLVNILGGDKKTFRPLELKLPDVMAKDHPGNPSSVTMKALRVLSGIEMTPELVGCLERLTNLRKLVIYKVTNTNANKSKLELFRLACMRTLVIIDHGENNISELFSGDIQASSLTCLAGLELCGKLEQVPTWIQELTALTKLTLPITVLRSEPTLLDKLAKLNNLFSLTFSTPTTPAPDPEATTTTENIESPLPCDKEIIVRRDGFANLKLLRFIAPLIQPLSFLDKAMPQLERIHLRFTNFQGLHGIHNLGMLKEVRIEVKFNAGDFTTAMLCNLVESTRQDDVKAPRIIRDWF